MSTVTTHIIPLLVGPGVVVPCVWSTRLIYHVQFSESHSLCYSVSIQRRFYDKYLRAPGGVRLTTHDMTWT